MGRTRYQALLETVSFIISQDNDILSHTSSSPSNDNAALQHTEVEGFPFQDVLTVKFLFEHSVQTLCIVVSALTM